MGKFIDLTGQRFGRLTVLHRAENRNKKTYWHCLCDCGNEKDIRASSLHDGSIKSCGCLNSHNSVDKTGQRFGMLVVKERLPNYKNNGRTYYKCDCDCGKEIIVLGSNLRKENSHTSSCGCQSSRNGTKQYDFLHQHRIDDKKKIYLVYKHTAPNGKIYIGMTKQSIDRRSQNGNGYSTQRLFYNAIKKYGWDNFKHEILDDNLTHNEACIKEQYYISYFKSNIRKYGYNITSGGDGCNHKGKHIVQKYNDEVVNCFKSCDEAARKLGFSSGSTISNYIKNKIQLCGFEFEEIGFDEYQKYKKIYNPQFLNIKEKRNIEHINALKEMNKQRERAINQYSLDGKYLNTYTGINKTQRELNITNIQYAISHESSAGGYQWRYDNGNYENIKPYHCNGRIIYQIDINSNKIISKFDSLIDAERNTGISFKQIWKVCNKKNKTAGGFIWRYSDEVENNTLEVV